MALLSVFPVLVVLFPTHYQIFRQHCAFILCIAAKLVKLAKQDFAMLIYAKGDYEKEMEQAALKKEAKTIKQTYIGGM